MPASIEEYTQAYVRSSGHTVRALCAQGVPYDVARDLSQSAWLKAWTLRPRFDKHEYIYLWVDTVAINLYKRERLMAARLGRQIALTAVTKPVYLDTIPFVLSNIISKCPRDDKAVLIASMTDDNWRDIASSLGTTYAAAKIHFKRACERARIIGRPKASLLTE